MIVAKFSTIAGGTWIDVASDRCFRFDSEGRAEYAQLSELRDSPRMARWYGHSATEKDFILC